MKVLIFFRRFIVLLIIFLSLSSFDNKKNNDKIFKHLSKLYQNDKHRCLEKASKMINRDHKNYIAYIYVLKCELDDSIFNKIDAYSHKLSNKKEAKFLVKKVRKLVRYAKIIEKNGVKIMGDSNILNKLPISSSSLYAKNVFNFVDNLFDKKNKKININLEDEIIEKTLIK